MCTSAIHFVTPQFDAKGSPLVEAGIIAPLFSARSGHDPSADPELAL